MEKGEIVVKIEKVTKVFHDHFVAVKDLTLGVRRGELIVLIGPSGCGKTTTLKMVNRLIEPTSGTIYFEGQDISKLNPVELRRNIGYVIQQIGLFPHMTIAGNIAIVPTLLKWPRGTRMKRVNELLELVDLDPEIYRDRFPRELSGGQQQRIGVLRALAVEPDLILMDEPFGALDPITREQLQEELKKLQDKLQKTIIFVTHDMDEALKLADRIVIMKEGKVVQVDTPDNILRQPANDFVIEFIGKDRLIRSPDEVTVGEVMNTRPVTIHPHHGLAEALEHMRARKVDTLVVVNDDRTFLGVVNYQQIQQGLNRYRQIREVMDVDLDTVSEDTSVREAVCLMAEAKLAYLVVVRPDSRLAGIFTRSSLVNILLDVFWPGETGGKNHDRLYSG